MNTIILSKSYTRKPVKRKPVIDYIKMKNHNLYFNYLPANIANDNLCRLMNNNNLCQSVNNNICSICHKTEPKEYLIDIWNSSKQTQTQTHAQCLISLDTQNKSSDCSIDSSQYRVNDPIYKSFSAIFIKPSLDTSIFFPYSDIYYEPLLSNISLIKVYNMDRLTYAIIYLQVKRVEELLLENDILDGLPNYLLNCYGHGQTPLIILAQGNLPSNCNINYGTNMSKYIQIFKLLLDTNKINLNFVDKFNRTIYDYVKKTNIQEFSLLLK